MVGPTTGALQSERRRRKISNRISEPGTNTRDDIDAGARATIDQRSDIPIGNAGYHDRTPPYARSPIHKPCTDGQVPEHWFRRAVPAGTMRPRPIAVIMFSQRQPAAGRANRMLRYVIATLVLLALNIGVAPAGEIRVLAAVAVKDPLDRFAQAFTRATGHKVDIGYSLTGPMLADIKAGKPVDAIVLPEQGKVALTGLGLLAQPVPVSASLAGVGVRAGAPMPDVSTLDAFKALLRAAPSI